MFILYVFIAYVCIAMHVSCGVMMMIAPNSRGGEREREGRGKGKGG